MSELTRYVFHIPLYNSYSNGIQILWQLAEQISAQRTVVIIPFDYNEVSAYVPKSMTGLVKTKYSPETRDIVIYPESIPGNPLKAKRVCRYILARPYTLNGQWVDYAVSDYLVYYSKVIGEGGAYLNIQNEGLIESLAKYIKNPTERKNQVAIYYGKLRCGVSLSIAKQLAKSFDGINIITRKYPDNKDDLYAKIAESRLFISLDPLTNLCYESTILGTPVYIADTIFEKEYGDYDFPLHGFLNSSQVLNTNFSEFNHAELSAKAVKQFKTQVDENKKIVFKFLSDIESHFSIKAKTNVAAVTQREREFVLNRWGTPPIVSGTNFNSVIGYHLISFNPYAYICAKTIWRWILEIRRTPGYLIKLLKDRIKKIASLFFDFSDPIISFYLIRWRAKEISLRRLHECSTVATSISSEGGGGDFAQGKIKAAIINLIWRKKWKSH